MDLGKKIRELEVELEPKTVPQVVPHEPAPQVEPAPAVPATPA